MNKIKGLHGRSWSDELGGRARRSLAVTVVGTTLLTALFFVGYFYVQRHPAYPPVVMPLTGLDRLIPFQSHALWLYLSLWIYIGAGPGLQRTFPDLGMHGLWMCGLCVTGLAIFYFWPTQVPPVILDTSRLPAFAVLHQVDASSNACPSMHVAVAIFTLVRVDGVFRSTRSPVSMRLLNLAWFAAIAYSTLAIKQHVVLDVVAGAALGLIFALSAARVGRGPLSRKGSRPQPDHGGAVAPPAGST